jgi:hypothetical protein
MKKSDWIKAAADRLRQVYGITTGEANGFAALLAEQPFSGQWDPERAVVPEVGWIWIAKDPSISGDKRALTEHEAQRGAAILNGFEGARVDYASLFRDGPGAGKFRPAHDRLLAFFQIEEGGE